MRVEDRRGEPLEETTVTVDDDELIDLLQGLADLVERKREHVHLKQERGPQLVVRLASDEDPEPIERQMDWWVGPLILIGALLIVVGAINVIGWAVRLVS